MCKECGCGLGGEARIDVGTSDDRNQGASHEHLHTHHHGGGAHHHPHHHDQYGSGYRHEQPDPESSKTVTLQRSLLEKNDRIAGQNRELFRSKNLLVLNVVSSPGSGKTTLIRETAVKLSGILRVGVIVGDLATDNDAARLRSAGVPVVQITTGTVCHLDAGMVLRAAERLDLDQTDLVIIENVGNLVCPADYDLGEDLRVVLLSVTEGEDKPLKYPPMFHSADAAIITKSDLADAAGFNREQALAYLRRISHHATIFELSAKTGRGMENWLHFLESERARVAE